VLNPGGGPAGTQRVVFQVAGMDCAEEVAALRQQLDGRPGVCELGFDVLRGRLTVAFDAGQTDVPALQAAVARAGLVATPWKRATAESATEAASRGGMPPSGGPSWAYGLAGPAARRRLTLGSGLSLLAGFAAHAASDGLPASLATAPPPAALLLYLGSIACGAGQILPKALAAARQLRPDMHLLMLVAMAGACLLGDWLEAASVGFLFALSLQLEGWSVGRARRAVDALLELRPHTATLIEAPADDRPTVAGRRERTLPAEQVPVGALLLVRPGERVPLDGRVEAGHSALDESPLTGESLPVERGPGDVVFAGSINGRGALELRTTRVADESTLARLARLVEEAQARRGRSEQLVERFARLYTPLVLLLAVATALLPPLLAGGGWGAWFYNALVLLVIACPCALVISTPVVVVSALAAAARCGVLVRGGPALEAPARLRCLAIDKTGTLTRGRPQVAAVLPLDHHTEPELLALAAGIEAHSSHPLAAAVVAHAQQRGVAPRTARELQTLPGQGVSAVVDGRPYWLGSHRYLEARGQETPTVHATLAALEADGHTAVALGNEGHVCGLLSLRDEPRAEAAAAVAELHALGVRPIVMLTGDNRGTAEVIAREIGIDEVRAELLPHEKLAAIEGLVARFGQVGMVGDGVNDAPALAAASLGVALGGAGSAAAVETADVVIMSDDLLRLPWLVRHARRARSVMRQNIAASIGVKLLFLGLALAGWSTLWGAIAADMGVSLAVVANALRLLVAGAHDGSSAAGRRASGPAPAGQPAGRGGAGLRSLVLVSVLALVLGPLAGCASLVPSSPDSVSGAEARLPGELPERVSVGGLVTLLGARTPGDQLVQQLFMEQLSALGLVQDEFEPELRFVGDLTLSAGHEPFGGHDAYLVLAAYVPGTEAAVWWCRVHRPHDAHARTRQEIEAVLEEAARLFSERLELWRHQ